jgi:hypothetical protein
MQSKKPVEPLDTFATDVPISPEESELLWRLRELNRMTPQEYAEFLAQFRLDPRNNINAETDEPFKL